MDDGTIAGGGANFKLNEINDVFNAMTKHKIIGRWVCEWD